ncbi:MAG: peptidoglycan DD-metalloendopeptidase family protein [Spirochaetia bacterium]
MHRSDIWIALNKVLHGLHRSIEEFLTSARGPFRRPASVFLPKRYLLPGLEKPKEEGPLRRIRSRLLMRFSSRRRFGYLLPLGLAAGLFLIISFISAPPVTGKILTKAPEAVPGLAVSFEGNDFGWIGSEAALYSLLNEMDPRFAWFAQNPEYWRQFSFSSQSSLDPEGDTRSFTAALEDYLRPRTSGYGIVVGDEPVAVLGTEAECRRVLNGLVLEFIPQEREGEIVTGLSIRLVENPRVVSGIYMREELLETTDAVVLLKKGTLEEKLYTVKPTDTVWSISREHGLTMQDIVAANPGMNPDRIYPGDVLNLVVPKPYISVEASYTHIYTRSVPFRTYVSYDPTLYRTEAVYTRRGEYGTERITAKVVLRNGLLKERRTTESRILSQPVSAMLRRGTARTPDDILIAGAFLPEGIGVITSYFGPRWGRFHYGIDVSAPLGTPVHAYAAGRVAYAGYNYILGHLITLVHEDGIVTRYGHSGTLLVENGDWVEAGQVIALSGNSGNSTGPHVHFEIRKSGIALDPLKYLKKLKIGQ